MQVEISADIQQVDSVHKWNPTRRVDNQEIENEAHMILKFNLKPTKYLNLSKQQRYSQKFIRPTVN